MNIFILDTDPRVAAKYHCNKHVVKMVTETAQMLCSVIIMSGEEAPYRLAHKNHPCTQWAMSSLSNWLWLKKLGLYLNREYNYRYGNDKRHKAGEVIKALRAPDIEDLGLTDFVQAMPEQYKNSDPVKAYRSYYLGEKSHILQYTNRELPNWIRFDKPKFKVGVENV